MCKKYVASVGRFDEVIPLSEFQCEAFPPEQGQIRGNERRRK
jgi:hypothetical protein